jgi:hypothetical protein
MHPLTPRYLSCDAKKLVSSALPDFFGDSKVEFTVTSIAAPRLRPLFKDKQLVEGSDGCGLFVDNFYFFKDCIVLRFYRVLIGLRCFNLRIMNPDFSGL